MGCVQCSATDEDSGGAVLFLLRGSSTSSAGRAQYQKEVKRDYCTCLVMRVPATKHLHNICINHPVMSIA